jgi:hypothetical protein
MRAWAGRVSMTGSAALRRKSPHKLRKESNKKRKMIYTHVLNKPGLAIRSPLDEEAQPAAELAGTAVGKAVSRRRQT